MKTVNESFHFGFVNICDSNMLVFSILLSQFLCISSTEIVPFCNFARADRKRNYDFMVEYYFKQNKGRV